MMRSPDSSQVLRSWPFFSTPPATFVAVMGPLTVMMALLAVFSGIPGWIRVSAAVIVLVTLGTFYRGYLCRIQATPTHVRYRTPLGGWSIPWPEVRHIGGYVPIDRNLQTGYVYITRRAEPPADRREIDADTLQLQDRPGLVEELQGYRRRAIRTSLPAEANVDDKAGAPPASAAERDDFHSFPHLTHGGTPS